MAKRKICSFCNKESKLFYSSPPCCGSWRCKSLYNQLKSKKGISTLPCKKVNKIKTFSDKKMKELAVYRKLRDEYLNRKPFCEIKSPKCTGITTELHHKKPRRYFLCDISSFCASCRACNTYVEENHEWARQNGFKIDHL